MALHFAILFPIATHMKKLTSLAKPRLLALLIACAITVPPVYSASANETMHRSMAAAQDQSLEKLSLEFLQALWRMQPDNALYAGRYEGAAQLPVPDEKERARQLAFSQTWLARFEKLDPAKLSPKLRTDLALLKNQLLSDVWYYTRSKEFAWNPSIYNVAGAFDMILNTEYAPKPQRLRSLLQRLQQVPAFYAAARASIVQPTAEHTQLAIAQSAGTVQVLQEVEKAAQASQLSVAQKTLFSRRTQAALQAVEEYTSWLRSLLAREQASRSFRLGKTMYEEKFALQIQTGLTGEQTYQRALQAKEQMLTRMDALADQLWPKYMAEQVKPQERSRKIGMVIDKLSAKHAQPENFVKEVRQQLPQLQQWLLDKNLLGTDASKPLEVREMPSYLRGVSVANIEAPGPYRPQDRTYYNVSPLTDMTPQQAESHLREYNHWILQILNIHEAIPGHYTQLVYANKSPSLIKSLFGNGSMIEGWAVYGELMMMESGWGDNTPEMWLMYSKWNLRAICNTILDYGVHVQGMTREQALQLLMQDAFQSETEANGKWRRAQLSSVQLASYFSGFSAIIALREERRQQLAEKFDLKQFHEQFLSYGSAPVPMIRELMIGQPVMPMMQNMGHTSNQHKALVKSAKKAEKPTAARAAASAVTPHQH